MGLTNFDRSGYPNRSDKRYYPYCFSPNCGVYGAKLNLSKNQNHFRSIQPIPSRYPYQYAKHFQANWYPPRLHNRLVQIPEHLVFSLTNKRETDEQSQAQHEPLPDHQQSGKFHRGSLGSNFLYEFCQRVDASPLSESNLDGLTSQQKVTANLF